MIRTLDRQTGLGVEVWHSLGQLVLRDKSQTLRMGKDMGEAPWEGEQYLFQPQTDWDHCRVCRIRPLAGTGPAGNLAAEGRREVSKRVKTTSYTLGSNAVGPRARTF